MTQYTVKPRGHERSVLITRGTETVAEVFTDIEAGDQYGTARLFAAAPDMLGVLRDAIKALDYAAIVLEAPLHCMMRETIERARAAVLAATGETVAEPTKASIEAEYLASVRKAGRP